MFAEESVVATPSLRLHSALSEALASARTPLDVLAALAEAGESYALDLWSLAVHWEGAPMLCLASVPPVSPAVASACREKLQERATVLAEAEDCRNFDRALVRALYLSPDLPPVGGEEMEAREVMIPLVGEGLAVVRVVSLQADDLRRPDWDRMETMVEQAAPYVRGLGRGVTTLAITDAESGTYSWPYFLDALERELERSRRQQSELSVAVLDLRPLPSGISLSPQLHGRVGGHLAEVVRRTDMVGRIGPSSYAVFFHNTGPRPALIAAGRIAEALRGDDALRSSLSFSMGVSGWECEGPLSLLTLLAQAGEASAEAATIAPDRAFVYL